MGDRTSSTASLGVGLSLPVTDSDRALLQASGAGWVRLALDFESDPTPVLKQLRDANLSVLLVVGPTIRSAATEGPDKYERRLFEHLADWKPYVRHFEIWNEPDSSDFWMVPGGFSAYPPFLRKLSERLKAFSSDFVIHTGGLGSRLPASLIQLYEAGVAKYFDVVNVQPYLNPLMPDSIGGLRYFHDMILRVLQTNGEPHKKIWYSAIGCPGLASPKSLPEWWLGKNTTEPQQAEWVRVLAEHASKWPNVETILWTMLADRPVAETGADSMGLVRADGTPKPAFHAFQRATRASLATGGSL